MAELNKKEIVEVLMVIDNQEEAEHIELGLRMGKFANELLHLTDASAAWDFLTDTTLTVLPKLILVDKDLSGMDGVELLRRIRENPRTSKIPVVIFLNHPNEVTLINQDGHTSHTIKPFQFEKFMQSVSEIGFYWLIVNKPPV